MKPIQLVQNLARQIEIKKAQAHLQQLKKTPPTNNKMKIFVTNPTTGKREAKECTGMEAGLISRVARLERENASLKSGNLGTVTNSATGQAVVPVTKRNETTGKIETVNMSMEQAAAYSKQMVNVAAKKTATTAKPQASAPQAAKPVASGPKLVTAAAFTSVPLAMSRDEFQKLSPADKSRFSKSGGRLV